MLIKIPTAFYEDYVDRGLVAPAIVKETKRHIWIDADSPYLSEFLDDAKHYAGSAISVSDFPELFGIKTSAKATIIAFMSAPSRCGGQ